MDSNHDPSNVTSGKNHWPAYVYDGTEVATTHDEAKFDSTPTDTKTLNSDGSEVMKTTCESLVIAFTAA